MSSLRGPLTSILPFAGTPYGVRRKRIGKAVGSDKARGKATAPGAVGVKRAERESERLLREARRIAAGLGRRAAEFESLTEFLLGRAS